MARLETSLKALNAAAKPDQKRIIMTHYPPIGADLQPSRASALLEKYRIDTCVFGHLHHVKPNSLPFGIHNGVRYIFTACDAINFTPVKL
ncbi:MAG: metallophosphoesterase [Pseudomonadota bacterium]